MMALSGAERETPWKGRGNANQPSPRVLFNNGGSRQEEEGDDDDRDEATPFSPSHANVPHVCVHGEASPPAPRRQARGIHRIKPSWLQAAAKKVAGGEETN
jgi:hypothetical protein